jgi:hypothetical protein
MSRLGVRSESLTPLAGEKRHGALSIPAPSNEQYMMPDVVARDAQLQVRLRVQFLGRDVVLPSLSVMASGPAHDPNLNALLVEALKKGSSCSQPEHLQPSIPSRHTKAARLGARATHTSKQSS